MTYDGQGRYSCDECPAVIDVGAAKDFNQRRENLSVEGWRTFKGPDGLWAQACPDCVAKFAEGRR